MVTKKHGTTSKLFCNNSIISDHKHNYGVDCHPFINNVIKAVIKEIAIGNKTELHKR